MSEHCPPNAVDDRDDRPNGEQVRLDPQSLEVQEVYPPNIRGETSSHFRKTKEQKVRLVEGAPQARAIVVGMYERYLVERAGSHRIAFDLNAAGIASPMGRQWSQSSVSQILNNPTYSGLGVANRLTSAIYYQRSAGMPSEAATARETPGGAPAQRRRPRTEWMVFEYPELAQFLPAHLRELARRHHEGILTKDSGGREAQPVKDKHGINAFILKGILRSKAGGYRMTGKTGGPGGTYRYYRVSRTQSIPTCDKGLRRLIDAGKVEAFVMRELGRLLDSAPGWRDQAIAETLDWQREQRGNDPDRADLEGQIARLSREIDLVVGQVHVLGETDARHRIGRLAARRSALEAQLGAGAGWEQLSREEVGQLVDEVLGDFKDLGERLGEVPPPELRRLLEIFIGRAEIDLEAGRLELELAAPS